MKRFKLLYPALICSLMFSQSVIASVQKDNFLVGVGYNFGPYDPSSVKHLLLRSSDHTQSWLNMDQIDFLPSPLRSAALNAINCEGDRCIAVGKFLNEDSAAEQPLILVSRDKGRNWTYKAHHYIPNPQPDNFNLASIACQGKFCFAVGHIFGYSTDGREAAIFVSKDHAETWARLDPTLLPKATYAFHHNACNDSVCVSVSHFYDKAKQIYHPLIFSTADQGNSWQVTKNIKGYVAKKDDYIDLHEVKCSDKSCVAVGSINVNDATPAIFVSNKLASEWSAIQMIDDVAINTLKNIRPYDMSCMDGRCVIIANSKNAALAFFSSDHGATWHFSQPIADKRAQKGWIRLSAVHCDNQACIAGGTYAKDNHSAQLPILFRSLDFGKSWSSVEVTNAPQGIELSNISKIKCEGEACLALGMYSTQHSHTFMLFKSIDHGATWKFANDSVKLPAGIASATLFDTASA